MREFSPITVQPLSDDQDHLPVGLDQAHIIAVFNQQFGHHADPWQRAQLVTGGDEPCYRPPTALRPWAEIVYARGLAASCLHEIAHWLHAGCERRMLADFGYWYDPDGRDDAAQQLFERSEIAIQAIEWILAATAQVRFHVSADNLRSPNPSATFVQAIANTVLQRLQAPLPSRFGRIARALAVASGTTLPTCAQAKVAWQQHGATFTG